MSLCTPTFIVSVAIVVVTVSVIAFPECNPKRPRCGEGRYCINHGRREYKYTEEPDRKRVGFGFLCVTSEEAAPCEMKGCLVNATGPNNDCQCTQFNTVDGEGQDTDGTPMVECACKTRYDFQGNSFRSLKF